ncbi:MAG: DNA cytosine methyltransferase [Capsulimonadaceae bacterium]
MAVKVVDFFSGCGGTSCGLRAAGAEIILAIDIDNDSKLTFRRNFPATEFLRQDIRRLAATDINEQLQLDGSDQLLFSACAPCQPFSQQNGNRLHTDARIGLLNEFGRFVRHHHPHYIFIENVPGMQAVGTGPGPFTDFLATLRELAYNCFPFRVIRSQDYGVPQRRQRLVLIASRDYHIGFPEATHGTGEGQHPYATVRQWIDHLPPIAAGETHPTIPNHRCMNLSARNLERIQNTPEGGGRVDWPEELRLRCHDNPENGYTDVYGRMRWDLPGSALTTRCISLSNGRFGHPTQHRAISVREAACLQTFPADFVFEGALDSMARQIGNAVPVRLAQRFGEVFVEHAQANYGGEV